MDTLSFKTLSSNKETARKEWFLIDAENQVLGRMSSKIAKILRGKYKTNFTPHADCGDYVIVINADKAIMTGKKMTDRKIYSHTGYPGGQKRKTPIQMLEKDGTSLLKHSVKGMLPKNRLGAAIIKNLHVYVGTEHKHSAQNPKVLNINDLK